MPDAPSNLRVEGIKARAEGIKVAEVVGIAGKEGDKAIGQDRRGIIRAVRTKQGQVGAKPQGLAMSRRLCRAIDMTLERSSR